MKEEIQQQQQIESADQAKAQQMSETALTKTEPTLEKIKNVNANKMVLAAREANGQFTRRGLPLPTIRRSASPRLRTHLTKLERPWLSKSLLLN